MLFNSYAFLFGFLPIVLAGYWLANRLGHRASVAWLSVASIFFYGYWNPPFLGLLAGSAVFNFVMGHFIGTAQTPSRKAWAFWTGIVGNLVVLGTFKYLTPSLALLHHLGATGVPVYDIVLPLGISFWTFTQIGYLVDRRDGLAADLDPLDYSLFVNFFPHLIAGPILHVREIGPQIRDPQVSRFRAASFAPGLTMFAIGLFKKVLIADQLASLADTGYGHAGHGDVIESWITMFSYSMQLYFDFSGYSDMAIGLAGMLGYKFPINFNSPYKSQSVIEYWQRWHITLTRYLNLLLFNPVALLVTRRRMARGLSVSSKATKQPAVFAALLVAPTFYTFILAGIWHGAGLQFLVFGLLQAVYISINHGWRVFGPQHPKNYRPQWWVAGLSIGATYLAAITSQTFFRAPSCADALNLLRGAVGGHGLRLPRVFQHLLGGHAFDWIQFGNFSIDSHLTALTIVAMILVWATPNSQQILGKFAPVLERVEEGGMKWLRWQPNAIWAVVTALLLWIAAFNLNHATTFIYFQF